VILSRLATHKFRIALAICISYALATALGLTGSCTPKIVSSVSRRRTPNDPSALGIPCRAVH